MNEQKPEALSINLIKVNGVYGLVRIGNLFASSPCVNIIKINGNFLEPHPWDSNWFKVSLPEGEITKVEKLVKPIISVVYIPDENLVDGQLRNYTEDEWKSLPDEKRYSLGEIYRRHKIEGEAVWQKVDFEVNLLCQIHDFPFFGFGNDQKALEFTYGRDKPYDIGKWTAGTINQLLIPPPIQLVVGEASMSGENFYKIICQHIKRRQHDGSIWRVTSDYDFHFEVCKVYTPVEFYESIAVNQFVNKKKKTSTARLVGEKLCSVLNITPKAEGFHGAEIVESIRANSVFELDRKIDDFLHRLDEFLDIPLVQCKHCAGRGYELQTQKKLKKLLAD